MKERLKKLRRIINKKKLEALLVTGPENRRYLSGFSGSNGWLLITKKNAFLLTDGRYWTSAKIESPDFTLVRLESKVRDAMFTGLSDLFKKLDMKGILGFEGSYVSHDDFLKLKKIARGTKLESAGGLVEEVRMIKDKDEISLIRKAAKLSDRVFKQIVTELVPGITEKEISARIHYLIESGGGESPSFESIVAFGAGAAMPHYRPSNVRLKKNDIVLIDMGSRLNGYCSDMTRTILVGNPGEKAKEIYRIVFRAQAEALKMIRPGVKGCDVDSVARKIIADAGYGGNYNHGLGHGIGMAVHEGPSLSPMYDKVLKPGMLVTVEPGIYIEGFGGVRIEDLVLVTEKGYEKLSLSPKQKV